jgi:hypothetical protein
VKTIPTTTELPELGKPKRVRPSWMKEPSPSPPTSTAMAVRPTMSRVETRMPAITTGKASGSRTLSSCWRGLIPMPRADSTTAGLTESRPVTVLRRIGSRP